jgi:thiosulfate reductase / polysulfide reductase chain A
MLTGKPYAIKGLVCYGMNLFQSLPNPKRTQDAVKALDFYVAIDTLPQEHVMWADVILPECTFLERYDPLFGCADKQPYIVMREPAVAPMYESKPGWWIARELGIRLGLQDFFPWDDYEKVVDWQLKAVGSSLEEMHKTGVIIQNGKPYLSDWEKAGTSPFTTTPSNKFEFFCQELADNKLDPLPTYEPVDAIPDGFLRLINGRVPAHSFTRTRNNQWLAQIAPENEVWIHPAVAAKAGAANGQRVVLENLDGVRSAAVKVRVTERVRPDMAYMPHGFGLNAPGMTRANGKGASDNQLQTRYKVDPVCGGSALRVNGVKIASVVPGGAK